MKLFITFIRHGTTQPNTEGRWAGSVDVPITEDAKRDLAELASKYSYPEVEKIYRSPLFRCQQTLEKIYPGREACVLPDAREFNFGDYEGKYAKETFKEPGSEAITEKKLDFRFNGGESFGECLKRGIRAIDEIVEDVQGTGISKIAVFTHAMWTSVLLKYCLEPPKTAAELLCGNGMGISVWLDSEEWKKDRILHFEGVAPEGAPRPKMEDSPYYNKKAS